MEWVFETRLEIDEADSTMELSAMLMQIQTEYDDKIAEIAKLFEEGEYEGVKKELDQTQYLQQMLTEIELKMIQLKDEGRG